ncbi:Hypothetical protein FNO222_1631 [Francisella orientalis]|uniref:Uncharacterized protein n=1 Tax=Francisella orientalis TaxID=299583 RepID=A0ABM5U841_9GAMM|nr:hypothetical protein FNO12_1616 [Francisella orientalis FNO12]AKN87683.1 Hypothetical protein FNO24_1618 [Francisella orientalis FNO24]AKN89221.1 Hypothetical protein FNO190_1616 [Francisella orientalis]AKU05980.1 Hypothetical protein FNO01_1616 [Francisella orientalis]QEN20898.1 Hypothetical protein FNO39_1631 [Francisella orientalis]
MYISKFYFKINYSLIPKNHKTYTKRKPLIL